MSEGEPVKIKNRPLRCKHCGKGQFVQRSAQLNTDFLEFFDLAWLNKSADVYVCTHCGFLHWFLDPQVEQKTSAEESAPEEDVDEPTECLACQTKIPAGLEKCPSCDWSYK
jgi:hypothetical protein